MIKLAGDVKGKKILIIGGAGHTQAHASKNAAHLLPRLRLIPS